MTNPPFPLQGKNREAAKRYYKYRTGKTINYIWKNQKPETPPSRNSSWFDWSMTHNPLNRSFIWFKDYEPVSSKED